MAQVRQAVAAFHDWLAGNRDWWQSDKGDRIRERILAGLPSLRGLDLVCYCPATAEHCHADVLIEWANSPEDQLTARIQRVRDRVNHHRAWRGEQPLAA
ncbi:DUF4326 domain-containing protein [Streptacidiphilus sp. ASG 303]|uniref:DUF4326 domain-containing protein n=1 Tax=Streptacidiphilus sp. ASG 303 TaxID=2896847 RepID=UPI0035B407D8